MAVFPVAKVRQDDEELFSFFLMRDGHQLLNYLHRFNSTAIMAERVPFISSSLEG